jgi:hypothetical protein
LLEWHANPGDTAVGRNTIVQNKAALKSCFRHLYLEEFE